MYICVGIRRHTLLDNNTSKTAENRKSDITQHQVAYKSLDSLGNVILQA